MGECEDRLVRYGGHAAAAGLTIDEGQLSHFRDDFCEAVSIQAKEHALEPEIVIDAEVPFGQLNLNVLDQIDMLAPFGEGNPRPLLCSTDVTLKAPATKMGKSERHLSVQFAQGNKTIRAVAFNAADWCEELNETDGPLRIAYRPVINEFRGYKNVEMHLVDWKSV
ncbi:MAG: hypothetical protein AAF664_03455 [Planctomycetota bacterium]